MKFTAAAVLAALASTGLAAPSATHKEAPRKAAAACSSAVSLNAKTNIWKNYKLHANNFYRAEVEAAVEQLSDESLKESAIAVADVGSFLWM
jgi:cellulose 1,4-beta-cellobiosidase